MSHKIAPHLLEAVASLQASAAKPVLTAVDVDRRLEQYRVPGPAGDVRLTVSTDKQEGHVTHVREEAWDAALMPSREEAPELYALLESSLKQARAADLQAPLSAWSPTLVMRGRYYVETWYALDGFEVRLRYPLFGSHCTKAFSAQVQRCAQPATSVEVSALPYQVRYVRPYLSTGLQLDWSVAYVGFGQFYFYQGDDGLLYCDNECMSKAFIRDVVEALLSRLSKAKVDIRPTLARMGFTKLPEQPEALKEAVLGMLNGVVLADNR